MLEEQTPLASNGKCASYDVESLFLNIPVDDTISNIINDIYQKNKLPQVIIKIVFESLLYKLTTEALFQLNYSLLR